MPFLVGYVTPQDWGAVADGVTDDTAAIQAAINAVGVNGGTLFFPATSASYLLNSSALSVSANEVTLMGAGPECVTLTIGASFSGTTAINITGDSCQVRDLSIHGASGTTTSNPVADAIRVTGARRARINRCTFYNVNGWAIQALATSGSSTTNPLGTQIGQIFGNQCAGGIRFLGNTTQAWAVNSSLTDIQFYLTGVSSGGSANLDGLRIEDSWDVLTENAILWMQNGSGSAYHVKGNSAASFCKNLDALGPNAGTGPNVLVDDSANGSPQNVQIDGGVIQQGSVGMQISGGATHIHLHQLRIINNTTHGLVVSGTGTPVYLVDVFFSLNGQGASGSNYDINWSSTTTLGSVSNSYFASPITSIGVAGVQQSVNITAAQDVMFLNVAFVGTSAASSNWFTAVPGGVLVNNSARFNFRGRIDIAGQVATQPTATGNTAFSTNINGNDSNDRYRVLGSGATEVGPGNAGRDYFYGRAAAGVGYASPTLLIGATTALGDNGVGEMQLANVTTAPTTNPTGGVVHYAANGTSTIQRDTAGHLSNLSWSDEYFQMNGFNARNMDPNYATTNNLCVTTVINLHKIYIPTALTTTTVFLYVTVIGATLTSGQNLVGLYNAAGTRVAVTADQSGNWTSTGLKTISWSSSFAVPSPGVYYVAILSNGTTPATFAGSGGFSTLYNANTTGATLVHAETASGQTSMPASLTMSSNVSSAKSIFVAIV